MKSLNDKELNRINMDDLLVKLAQEKLASALLKHKNLELSIKVLSLELVAQKDLVDSLRKQEADAKISRAENLKILAKKKNLKEGWGFNPDTGEIVE